VLSLRLGPGRRAIWRDLPAVVSTARACACPSPKQRRPHSAWRHHWGYSFRHRVRPLGGEISVSSFRREILRLAPPDRELSVPLIRLAFSSSSSYWSISWPFHLRGTFFACNCSHGGEGGDEEEEAAGEGKAQGGYCREELCVRRSCV
jgi:hypothetical protein